MWRSCPAGARAGSDSIRKPRRWPRWSAAWTRTRGSRISGPGGFRSRGAIRREGRPRLRPPAGLPWRRLGWVAVLAGAPLAYFWLIGRYGWSDTDDGFVLASGWRVHLGQTPYRD